MKYCLSSLPASPCHCCRVIGSLVGGVPADTAPSIWVSWPCWSMLICLLKTARLVWLNTDSASRMSPCRVAAITANAARSAWVIRCPASIPDSSAYSWDSASRADTVAISPRAWPGRDGVGQAVRLGQEQPGLVQDDPVVPAERLAAG